MTKAKARYEEGRKTPFDTRCIDLIDSTRQQRTHSSRTQSARHDPINQRPRCNRGTGIRQQDLQAARLGQTSRYRIASPPADLGDHYSWAIRP